MKIIIVGSIGKTTQANLIVQMLETLKEHRPDIEVEYKALEQVSEVGRRIDAVYKDEMILAEYKEALISFLYAMPKPEPQEQLTLMIRAPQIGDVIWLPEKKKTKGHERPYKFHK